MATLDDLLRNLQETHEEITQVRCQVVESLRAFYSSTSAISIDDAMKIASKWVDPLHTQSQNPHKSELQERMDMLNGNLAEIVKELNLDATSSSQVKLIESFTQQQRLKKQIEQSRNMMSLIEKLAKIDNLLHRFDGHIDKYQISNAATLITQIEESLKALLEMKKNRSIPEVENEDLSGGNDEILKLIRLQYIKKKNHLLNRLSEYFTHLIVFHDGTIRLNASKTRGSDPSKSPESLVEEFWRAAHSLGLFDKYLKETARNLSQQIIKPLLTTSNAALKLGKESNTGASILQLVGAGKKNSSTVKKKAGLVEVEHKIQAMISVLGFVHSELFVKNNHLMKSFSEVMWKIPGNLESMLVGLLQDKIPQDASALGSYKDAMQAIVSNLEVNLVGIGFDISHGSQLRYIVDEMNQLYSKKRRQLLLCKARELMSQDYQNSLRISGATERCSLDASGGTGKKTGQSKLDSKGPTGSGSSSNHLESKGEVENGCFNVPDYRITSCAHDIVELTYQTLLEACSSGSSCANLLFQTSRDILFMFRAVISTLYEDQIRNDARTCMLFHNDCMYISLHMLTLGHQFKSRLPPPLNQTGTMVDMVPSFRDSAEHALMKFAKSQSDDIVTTFLALPPLGMMGDDSLANQVEQYIKGVSYKFNHLSATWKEGLPVPVYLKVISMMIDPFMKTFCNLILKEATIPATSISRLHHFICLALECGQLFDTPAQSESFVPNLSRLRAICSLMIEPLPTIRDRFQASGYSCLTSVELAIVIKTIFKDSKERKDFLNLL